MDGILILSLFSQAFEHLCSLEIVRPTEGATSRTQKEYRSLRLMANISQITEAVKRYPSCPNELKHWGTTPMLTL
jgi:origin recognition complex subunit 4